MPRKAGHDPPLVYRPHQHVGELLHQLRDQARITQNEVAVDIGIHQSFLSRIERGQRPAPERVLRYYAERFGSGDLIAQLFRLETEATWQMAHLRNVNLIIKQQGYPLPGDESTFVSADPPDGFMIPFGASFIRTWTIRNSGTVPWRGRRLRRLGAWTGPAILTSERFIPIPDADPGEEVTFSVEVRAPRVETTAIAQFKMVDEDNLLYYPLTYSFGLMIHLLVGHTSSPRWQTHQRGDRVA